MKDAVANAPAAHNIPVIQIESKTAQINDVVEYDLSERLKETFGVVVSGIDIGAIEIDKTSEGYRELMSITKDLTSATAKAEAEAKLKDIAEKQRIEAEHYEESLRVQREEGQYAQHMQTRQTNLGAYQTEKQAEASPLISCSSMSSENIRHGTHGRHFPRPAWLGKMPCSGVCPMRATAPVWCSGTSD